MRRSSFTPAVMCAADASMLGSFVLSFFSLGDAGQIIGSAGVTDAVHSPPIASLSFSIPIAVCEHLVSLYLDHLSRLHQTHASHLLLVCACCSGEKC